MSDEPVPHASTPVIELRNLTIRFDGAALPAVCDVSLELRPGECLAIVGESGSGKTLTARSLLGLAPPGAQVELSHLSVGGIDATALTSTGWRALRGRVAGLVSQDALGSLDPLRRVGREVAESAEIHGLPGRPGERKALSRSEVRARVAELLERVWMPEPEERARQYPHQLSGGQRQRALIAAALSAGPGVLIADEPTTALDVTVQGRVLELLSDLKASGIAVLLISHDLAVVARIADRVMVMHNGTIVETGGVRQVLTMPREEYTRSLLAAVPTLATTGESATTSNASEAVPPATVPPATVPPATVPPATVPPATVPPATASSAVPVLRTVGLSRSFHRSGRPDRLALQDVSVDLYAGESLGVVGESGSGKTTLARLMLAYDRPLGGVVEIGGRPWSALPERARRSRRSEIQLIGQDPLASFDPRYSVRRILTEAVRESDRAARDARLGELLGQVGLDVSLLPRRASELSGGQRQRVAIARALAPRPRILVCDEPVSALDVSVQSRILALLGHIRRETGLSIVFVSHDLAVVSELCDRVLVMKDGRVIESGRTLEVFSRPQHPFTRELLAAVPRLPD